MPTMAMGSSRSAGATGAVTSVAAGVPWSSASRWPARAVGVGWSKTTVGASRRPVAARRRSRMPMAAREATPRSRKALRMSRAAAASVSSGKRTAAVCTRTRARSSL